jgi:hypothetical protein
VHDDNYCTKYMMIRPETGKEFKFCPEQDLETNTAQREDRQHATNTVQKEGRQHSDTLSITLFLNIDYHQVFLCVCCDVSTSAGTNPEYLCVRE